MKTIFLSVILLSGAMAQAQTTNSQASQIITLRLQPISFIDLSAVVTGKPAKQPDEKVNSSAASMHEIIVNKNLSADASLPAAAALQNEEKNNYRNMMTYNSRRSQPVYTFSSR